jgi:selenide, water dikinase
VLAQVLGSLPPIDDPNVLVGTSTADDAGIYRLNDRTALVETVDFFTPIVDEPRTFGRIAAANALSDVYAMGGTPLCALAIACFPENQDPQILAEILAGGVEKAHEAGIHVIGGHTVKDPEPKYGLAVTGVVHPHRIIRNSTARPGDVLLLTKPIGTGILTTANRKDVITEKDLQPAIASMETLNRAASAVMVQLNMQHSDPPVHAATDVTGFGLTGHLLEVARGSGVGFALWARSVPLFEHVLELAEREVVPGGTRSNLEHVLAAGVVFERTVPTALQLAMCDSQTSGGLLICVGQQFADELVALLNRDGVSDVSLVGALTAERSLLVADR